MLVENFPEYVYTPIICTELHRVQVEYLTLVRICIKDDER